jgi:hypothetical protein
MKKMDQFEAQLLSLEWEITEEKIGKAIEETKALRPFFPQRDDLGPLLEGMEKVMEDMKADQTRIHPSMISFLLDGKETLKLMLREGDDPDLTLCQKLALDGFKARFTLLQQEQQSSPVSDLGRPGEETPEPVIPPEIRGPEEIPSRVQAFLARAEDLLQRIEQRLQKMERMQVEPPLIPLGGRTSFARDITVFKVYGKLYGVESESVLKVLKVPLGFQERYGHLPRIRIREEEVALVDLPRILPEESWGSGGVKKLVMIRGEGECKGLLAEEVLKRLRIVPETGGGGDKPLMGIVHWVHEARPVEIPILDPKRL